MDTHTEFVNDSEIPKKSKRKIWAGHCGYILSLFGYTSGSGDFWRFPYLYWKNGGGAFIFVYLFAVMVCSIPLYYLEVTISQYSGKGMYDVWCMCPLFSDTNNNQVMGHGEGHGEGKGQGGAGLLWAICWFLILILLAWPVGFFVSWLYVLLLPFGACIEPVRDICDSLLKVVRLPYVAAENMKLMKPVC